MDWIFEHFQIVVVIGSAIAWWLTQRKAEGAEDAPPPSSNERPGRQSIDWEQQSAESDAAEQVRERMRRLREQRGQSHQPSTSSRPAPAPRPAQPTVQDLPPVLRELMGIPEPRPEPTPPPVPQVSAADRMAAQMRELEAKQREAEAMVAQVHGQMKVTQKRRRNPARPAVSSGRDALSDRDFLRTLRDPGSARRAIILKEVLDRPVGLR